MASSEFTAIPKEMDPEAQLVQLLEEMEAGQAEQRGSDEVPGDRPSGNLRDGTYQANEARAAGAEGEGPEPKPSVNMERLAGKRTSLDTLFAQVMRGDLPRGRALKSWEPDRLDERHLNVIMLRASGMDQGRIAEITGFTEPWVSIILNHPDAQTVLAKIIGYAADNVLDLSHRIQGTAAEAFDTVVHVMRTTPDEAIASRNAFEILKMAGYGPLERKSVQHSFGLSDEGAKELAQAMRETAGLRNIGYAEYTVVPSPAGVSSGSPATSSATGQPGGGAPPTDGQQARLQHPAAGPMDREEAA